MELKPGTIIELHGTPACGGFPGVEPEIARIARPRKENLPSPGPGWHVVRFDGGGKLYVHESRFRVVGNQPWN